MILLGSLVNALLIILGSIIGRLFKNIPDTMKNTVLSIIGLAVAVLGIQMGFKSSNFIIVIVSLVLGAVIGEWLDLDKQLIRLGKWVESKLGKKTSQNSISEGFVNATLIF